MLASLLALAAAPGYGASDFLAGLKARTLSTVVVAAVSQGAGLLFAAAIVAARGRPPPGPEFVVYALLTGVAAAVGLTSLYRALAMGPMGIVSPIAATSVIIPVAVGVLGREAERPAVDRDPRMHRRRGARVARAGRIGTAGVSCRHRPGPPGRARTR